jgi:hypothetical protein
MADRKGRMKIRDAVRGISRWCTRYPLATGVSIYAAAALVFAVAVEGSYIDDAYIFFQYARTWAASGSLAFNPGEPSYGMTSIVWTAWLTVGQLLFGNVIFAAKLWGILFGAAGAALWCKWLSERLEKPFSLPAMVWAALLPNLGAGWMVCGMEIPLATFFTGLLLVVALSNVRRRPLWEGIVGGVVILVRPDLAVFPVGLAAYRLAKRQYIPAIVGAAVAGIVAAPWSLWLYAQTGALLPPTRYGKLAVFLPEHIGPTIGQFAAAGIGQRLVWAAKAWSLFPGGVWSHVTLLLLTAAAVILPLARFVVAHKKDAVGLFVPGVGVISLFVLYGLFFPLLQLRYFVWIVPGLIGAIVLGGKDFLRGRWPAIVGWSVTVVFLVLFIPTVVHRVAVNRYQQVRRSVATAIQAYTPFDSRIALEPIGEIGYYSDRYIVDMGGLVSASIRPWIVNGYQDTVRIWDCLVAEKADYLVTYADELFLGRLPAVYPDRFALVTAIPPWDPVYRLYRIIK